MGPVMDLAKAVSECPSGGQIVCCQGTFAGILDQQARILQTVPEHADHDLLYDMLRSAFATSNLVPGGLTLFGSSQQAQLHVKAKTTSLQPHVM